MAPSPSCSASRPSCAFFFVLPMTRPHRAPPHRAAAPSHRGSPLPCPCFVLIILVTPSSLSTPTPRSCSSPSTEDCDASPATSTSRSASSSHQTLRHHALHHPRHDHAGPSPPRWTPTPAPFCSTTSPLTSFISATGRPSLLVTTRSQELGLQNMSASCCSPQPPTTMKRTTSSATCHPPPCR
jgi:hypothetical protein